MLELRQRSKCQNAQRIKELGLDIVSTVTVKYCLSLIRFVRNNLPSQIHNFICEVLHALTGIFYLLVLVAPRIDSKLFYLETIKLPQNLF